jgi:hypothetical protein
MDARPGQGIAAAVLSRLGAHLALDRNQQQLLYGDQAIKFCDCRSVSIAFRNIHRGAYKEEVPGLQPK